MVRFTELLLQLETGCKYQEKGKKEVTYMVATWEWGGGVVSLLLSQVKKKNTAREEK